MHFRILVHSHTNFGIRGTVSRFFDTDIWVHDTEIAVRQKKVEPLPYLYPASSDKSVQGFRRWWKDFGFANAPRHTFGPASAENLRRLSRKGLTDAWTSHTKHCSICRGMLKRAHQTVKFSFGLAIAGASLVATRHARIGGLLCLAASWILHRQAQQRIAVLEGEATPSQVGDRTVAAESG